MISNKNTRHWKKLFYDINKSVKFITNLNKVDIKPSSHVDYLILYFLENTKGDNQIKKISNNREILNLNIHIDATKGTHTNLLELSKFYNDQIKYLSPNSFIVHPKFDYDNLARYYDASLKNSLHNATIIPLIIAKYSNQFTMIETESREPSSFMSEIMKIPITLPELNKYCIKTKDYLSFEWYFIKFYTSLDILLSGYKTIQKLLNSKFREDTDTGAVDHTDRDKYYKFLGNQLKKLLLF